MTISALHLKNNEQNLSQAVTIYIKEGRMFGAINSFNSTEMIRKCSGINKYRRTVENYFYRILSVDKMSYAWEHRRLQLLTLLLT